MIAVPTNKIERLLVLVFDPAKAEFDDFLEISREIQRLEPTIAIHIVTPLSKPDAVPAYKWNWPAFTIGIGTSLGLFTPLRGGIMQAHAVKKLEQYHRFRSLGIATPMTERFDEKHQYLEDRWSEFVVLKPLPLSATSRGGHIMLMRTRRLEQLRKNGEIWPVLGDRMPRLVQTFVDTGNSPTIWRVMTLLGKPLHSHRTWCATPRASLDANDQVIEKTIIETKHPYFEENFSVFEKASQVSEPQVLEFAHQVSRAYSRIPLQGIDIVKDYNSGKLYALEINGGGNTWHFSSPMSKPWRDGGLSREMRISQFGAWKVAAEALIAATVSEAS